MNLLKKMDLALVVLASMAADGRLATRAVIRPGRPPLRAPGLELVAKHDIRCKLLNGGGQLGAHPTGPEAKAHR